VGTDGVPPSHGDAEHFAYVGADVLAKHLHLFVYNHNVV